MKFNRKVNFLKGSLNIFATSILLSLLIFAYRIVSLEIPTGIIKPIPSLMFAIFLGSYLIIILSLRNILNTILDKNPFVHKNVVYFKRIGYLIFLAGLADAIVNYPRPNTIGMEFLSTSYGTLKPIFFLYIALSCLAFILGDVFKMAIEIKDDNNLTI